VSDSGRLCRSDRDQVRGNRCWWVECWLSSLRRFRRSEEKGSAPDVRRGDHELRAVRSGVGVLRSLSFPARCGQSPHKGLLPENLCASQEFQRQYGPQPYGTPSARVHLALVLHLHRHTCVAPGSPLHSSPDPRLHPLPVRIPPLADSWLMSLAVPWVSTAVAPRDSQSFSEDQASGGSRRELPLRPSTARKSSVPAAGLRATVPCGLCPHAQAMAEIEPVKLFAKLGHSLVIVARHGQRCPGQPGCPAA